MGLLMGLLSWLSHRVGRDLDEQVQGAAGVARDDFSTLIEGAPLLAQARLTSGHGNVRLHVQSPTAGQREDVGDGAAALTLDDAEAWRGGSIAVTGQAKAPAGSARAIAALVLEVRQPDPAAPNAAPLALQTYSVESRFDERGDAELQLIVRLGN